MKTSELNNLTLNELLDLNSKVVKLIKLKRKIEGAINLVSLKEGMSVEYVSRSNLSGRMFTIKKINRVNVVCEDKLTGQLWNITS